MAVKKREKNAILRGSFSLSMAMSLFLLLSPPVFSGCGKETAAYDPEVAHRRGL